MKRKSSPLAAVFFFLGLLADPASPARAQDHPVITLDPDTTYQTITGWEAIVWAANDSPAFPDFIDEVVERVVKEAGITRIRLEVRSGAETDRDYWSEHQRGEIEYETWRCFRYATVNDDGDPEHINWEGFRFSELDWVVEHIVLPMKQVTEAGGEKLFINVNYVAFTGQIQCGGSYLHGDSREYAEFVLATYLHLKEKYGWVPDAWEVILEPDNVSQWNGRVVASAIVAAAARLEAAGFAPRFIAPSTTNMGNASTYFDDMVRAAPECLAHLDEIAYHRYGGVSSANLQKIVDRALANNLNTSMLEWWNSGNTYATLHEDLRLGRNSAWQRGVLVGEGNPDTSAKLYTVDTSDPENPRVVMNHGTRYLRQYFRFVRPGAVRIGAQSTSGALDPLAFAHPHGGQVVVVKATRGSTFSIANLAPGTYGITYTTGTGNNSPSAYNVGLAEVTVGRGDALETSIPAAGVITIHGETPPSTAFIRGDANADAKINVSDAVFILLYLFTGLAQPLCTAIADADASGGVELADAVFLLAFLFEHGPPPVELSEEETIPCIKLLDFD